MLDVTGPKPLQAPLLERLREHGLRHGFFTRAGGVSQGIYRGLNVGLGSDDESGAVMENRSRVAHILGVSPQNLLTVHQVHSPEVVVVSDLFSQRPKADAMVTDRPGLALGVLTADCGPVLFAEPEARIVGAAHAGWKGALSGILENTIAAMENLGAERAGIVAVLGPAIGQENYEVGPEFVERFVKADTVNERWFRPSGKEGHALFDLNGYTVAKLLAAGVTAACLDRCTYADEDAFFSYRRATHRGETDYGRQISAIVLENH